MGGWKSASIQGKPCACKGDETESYRGRESGLGDCAGE